MEKNGSYFAGLKVKEPSFLNMGEGTHRARLVRYHETNSFENFDGSIKDADLLPKWEDPTPQLVMVFGGKEGGIVHRFNGAGYKRYEELTEEQIKSGKYQNLDGYACTKNKNGQVVRILDEERSEQAVSILSNAAWAMGGSPGDDITEVMDKAIANQTEVEVTIGKETYDGRDQYRITRMNRVGSTVTAEAGSDEGDVPY